MEGLFMAAEEFKEKFEVSTFNRFDFEQKILACWSIVEQIEVITRGVMENDWTSDQVSNATIGLKELYNQHFDELFSMFESGVRNKQIT